MEQKLDAVLRYLTADNDEQKALALEEMEDLLAAGSDDTPLERNLEEEIEQVMLVLGIPEKLKGYELMATALKLTVENPSATQALTSFLYPKVAELHQDTASRAERAIRHTIEVAWERCDQETLERYFGNTVAPSKGKPTNGEFIARIASVIRKRIRG
jgi:two-component system response regulator (stage 0 sporulation protein A)